MMTDLFRPLLQAVRLLLVDDHEDCRDQFDEVLRDAGALVTTVGAARDAVQSLGAVDIVVTNLTLPDHDGRWLLGQIEGSAHRVPVIAVTGPGDLRELAEPGCIRVLQKPVNPWRLITEIRLALDR
jgi:DNA-binding NtrC family response regulator